MAKCKALTKSAVKGLTAVVNSQWLVPWQPVKPLHGSPIRFNSTVICKSWSGECQQIYSTKRTKLQKLGDICKVSR